jgi:hypothetical protein
MHLDGRHPYLQGTDLDYETRDVVLTVPAKDWNDAAKQGFNAIRGLNYWRASVASISGPAYLSKEATP